MTAFLAAIAGLTLLALAWVLPPLLRRQRPGDVDHDGTNLALMREQLAELDADLAGGTLSPEQHGEARRELERRVLEESATDVPAAPAARRGGRVAAVLVALFVPVAAGLFYLYTGSPGALDPQRTVPGHAELTQEQFDGMIVRLEARLKERPDDANGWVLLARSKFVLQRFDEAVEAYSRAAALVKDNANLYADYADALAMKQGRRLQGEPERLIAQALKIDPDHVKALALAGTVAFEKQDYAGALRYWERILKVAEPDSPSPRALADPAAAACGARYGWRPRWRRRPRRPTPCTCWRRRRRDRACRSPSSGVR